MIIYLYVKTHRVTGLKYLGKTQQSNPHLYKGSGKRWLNHLKVHGYDVETTILKECNTNDELKFWGLYYSSIFDVVNDSQWANIIPESGDGFTKEDRKKWLSDPENIKILSEKAKTQWKNPEYRSLKKSQLKKQLQSVDFRHENSKRMKEKWKDHEYKKNITENSRNSSLERWENSEFHKKMSDIFNEELYKERQKNSHYGKNNVRYDHTQYNFINDNGIEEVCTQHELYTKYNLTQTHVSGLINGKRKSHKGWRLKNNQ